MRFFDRVSDETEPELEPPQPRPAWAKPEAALAGVVPVELVLARTPEALLAVQCLFAYPTGFEFCLTVLLRHADRYGERLGRAMHRWPGPAEPPDTFLRLGVGFADGRIATNVRPRAFPRLDSEPSGPLLLPGGGGGGQRRYDMTYWVWPLPPPGPLTLGCEWPAYGIGETSVELDAQLVLDAAGRAEQLWPEDDRADG